MRLFHSTLLLLLGLILSSPADAAPPRTLSYQGVLTDGAGSVAADGSYSMQFAIYGLPSGGAALWTETQSVTVNGGNFDVVLGSVTPITALSFEIPYWLGLAVDGDPEMTPRTELTAVAYSQIARTVEDAAITSDKLADDTAVRSINGLSDAVSIVAGANVTVTPVGTTLVVSATGADDKAPGIASAKGITSGTLGSSITSLASRTINCPGPGYAMVIGSSDIYLNHVAGNPTYVTVGISNSPSALPTNQDLVAQIPFSAPSGTYTIPLTSHGVYPVTAGNNTFYLLGRRGSVSGTASAGNRQLSVIYIEQSYGTVAPPAPEEFSGASSGEPIE